MAALSQRHVTVVGDAGPELFAFLVPGVEQCAARLVEPDELPSARCGVGLDGGGGMCDGRVVRKSGAAGDV